MESVMLAQPDYSALLTNIGRYTDIVRLKGGRLLTVRFVEQKDAGALMSYFRALSRQSRYNRLMGAASELPSSELDKTLHVGEGSRFAVIAEMKANGADAIVGEARYSYNAETRNTEFGLSIGDEWQGKHWLGDAVQPGMPRGGVGSFRLFGETFRNNEQMIGLARSRLLIRSRTERLAAGSALKSRCIARRIFPAKAGNRLR
jgi:acetyltransferase